jgi:outer membrane protein OmpA-like peptidoglycan-associated protein
MHDPWLIFFQRGETEIIGDGRSVLANVPPAFKSADGLCIELIGHADFNEGSQEKKQQLSETRAATVKRILVANGTSASAITVRGVSDKYPIAAKSHPSNQFVSIDFCSEKR